MKNTLDTVNTKIQGFSTAKFIVSLIGVFLALVASITSAVTFLIDARMISARQGIVSDLTPITDELRKQTTIMESRLQLLELSVVDRWTATDMANLMSDLTSELRDLHPGFKKIDPYEVRARRMVK